VQGGKMLELYLIRHAESEINRDKTRIGGRSNYAQLTQWGMEQAKLLAQRLFQEGIKFDEIYTSPAIRAIETAKIVCSAIGGLDTIVKREDIQELSEGDWEGKLRAEMHTEETLKCINSNNWEFRPPNGESQRQVEERMYCFVENLTIKDGKIGVFGHGMSFKCLLRGIMGFSPSLTYRIAIGKTSITRLNYDKQGWHLLCVNDTAHLSARKISDDKYGKP
jgi:broad specificity phosphatase PhoE